MMELSHAVMNAELSKLAFDFFVDPKSCDNPSHYDNFIRYIARDNQRGGYGVTHILVDESRNKIAGYITLRATSLLFTSDGKTLIKPSLEIAELAVDKEYKGNKIGSKLVDIALLVATEVNKELLGIRYVVLCSDPASVGFYEKKTFGRLEEFYDVIRDGCNNDCTPMYMNISES